MISIALPNLFIVLRSFLDSNLPPLDNDTLVPRTVSISIKKHVTKIIDHIGAKYEENQPTIPESKQAINFIGPPLNNSLK